MNVIVSNKNKSLLESLDIDVIKSINGEFSVEEIISTFSNFFFNRMFLDITAIKDYTDISNIQKLSIELEQDKIILVLDSDLMNNRTYLSKLISMGIYNFGNTKDSLLYLYNHPNTYKDVAQYHNLDHEENKISEKKNRLFASESDESDDITSKNAKVIGFKNATSDAGATTLIYMLKKVLSNDSYTIAIEVNKNDFGFFNEKDMYSVNESNLDAAINKFGSADYILIDLNNSDSKLCDEIIYLLEPSIIKLNKMMILNKNIFDQIMYNKIVLNKSLLTSDDVKDFETESHTKISYNLPPLNDRNINTEVLLDFIEKLEIKK